MNEECSRGMCILGFKQEAVRQVKAGRAASVVAKTDIEAVMSADIGSQKARRFSA